MHPGTGSPSANDMFGQPTGFHMPRPWYPYNQQHPAFRGMQQQPPFPPGYQPNHPHTRAHPHSPHFMGPSVIPQGPYMHSPPGVPPPEHVTPSSYPGAGHAYSISLSVAQGATPMSTRTEAVMSWQPPGYATPVYNQGRRKRSLSLPGDGDSEKSAATPSKKNVTPKASSTKKSSATQTPALAADVGFVSGIGFPPPLLPPVAVPTQNLAEDHKRGPVLFIEQHNHRYTRYEPSAFPPPPPVLRSYSAPLPDVDASRTFLVDRDSSSRSVERKPPFSSVPNLAEQTGNIEPLPVLPQPRNHHDPVQSHSRQPAQRVGVARRRNSNDDKQTVTATGETTEEGFEWFQGQLLLESDEDSEDEPPQTPFPV